LKNTKHYILSTLIYFDIFHYPLTREEIQKFHGQTIAVAAIDEAIILLLEEQHIFLVDGFYSLHNNKLLAAERRRGNQLALQQMPIAKKAAKILSRFPYVKGLAISGSLSKNCATEKTDIDFFIITKANRLWIARTIMHVFKKLTFITGKQKWFCMNYYVDETGLEIVEKNIFTAMEIVTLLPMQGGECVQIFLQKNEWVKNYFPCCMPATGLVPEMKKGFTAKFVEKICNARFGYWLDTLLMNITDRRWQKKALISALNKKNRAIGMSVSRHFSKPRPENFQQKVVLQYEKVMDEFIQKFESGIRPGENLFFSEK
jgi:predicted nucleotidyltransferase